jgi:DnaK suppressor protein
VAKKVKKTTKKKAAVKKKTTAKKAKVKAKKKTTAKKAKVKAKKKTTAKKTTKKAAAKKTAKKKTVKKKTKKAAAKKTVKKAAKKKTVKKTVKKVVKKAVKKRRPKKHSPLTKEEVKHFMAMLLEKRTEIIGDVNSIESEALRKSRIEAGGDLSSMPIHMADVGTDNFEQEFALGLMDSERKLLSEINDALKRIIENRYGICEGTNNPISKARLEASPWSRYCIEYAIMVEKGQVIEGEKIYEENEDYDVDDFSYTDDNNNY